MLSARSLVRAFRQRLYPIPYLGRRFVRRSGDAFRVRLRSSPRCLDIGAGVAPYRNVLQKSFALGQYVALDIAPSDATTVVADATKLPFADSSIDVVAVMETLQHIPNAPAVLDEIARVMVPGGLMIASYPFVYAECDVHDFRRWTIEGMEYELKERGFVVLESRRRGGPFFAAACLLIWCIQHAIPGARRSWRARFTTGEVARAAVVQILSLPLVILAWAFLGLDAVLPPSGLYIGGLTIAERQAQGTVR